MGRLVFANSGDSSPSSAESSYRELDELFLQTQTRIWIGEVLNTRLEEDLHISDLLQDGEILFEVSTVVWNLLVSKCMELSHLKQKCGSFSTKKSSGRYRPYSNVDSFLKICKILGLSGIDLFSPSDVVEKKDIRKVCTCIRALSKKARSKQLKVPDFNKVMYSIAMPTDMVGGIRRNLEASQSTLSSSSSYSSSNNHYRPQTNMHAPSDKDDESSSEDSDEAESRYMGENSISLATGVKNEERSNQYNNDMNFIVDNDNSVVGDSSSVNLGESNYISDYLAFSDLMVHHHATDDSSSVILGEENNNMFDFFLNIDSQNSKNRSFQNEEDMEVSSSTSMTSVLGRMLNLEFDDQFDANVNSSASMEHEVEKHFCWENCDDFVDSDQTTPLCEEKDNSKDYVTSDSTLCKGDSNDHISTIEANKQETDTQIHPCLPVKDLNKAQQEDNSALKGSKSSRPLLKTVFKGTVIAAVLFLLLHVRQSKGVNNAQETKKGTSVSKFKGRRFSFTQQQTGSKRKGIYPAEKIRL